MLVYFGDIVILLTTFEELLQHIKTVLGPLLRADVWLKLEKCFLEDGIDYQRPVIKTCRLAILMKVTDAIHILQSPFSITELRSSLSPCHIF